MMATRRHDTLQDNLSPLATTRSDEDVPRLSFDDEDDSVQIEATTPDRRVVLSVDPSLFGDEEDDPTALHNRASDPVIAYARAVVDERIPASGHMRRAAYHLVRAYQAAHEDEREAAIRALTRAFKNYGRAEERTWPAELRTLSERVIERLS